MTKYRPRLERMNAISTAPRRRCRAARRGQSLVEFAVVALVVYMLLAAILTFGHALYVAQGLQTAADLAAKEISRTPLPADPDFSFDDALMDDDVRKLIFDEALLVIDLDEFYENFPVLPGEERNVFRHLVPTLPSLNQQLVTMMIVDHSIPGRRLLRYPGALLKTTAISPPTNAEGSPNGPYDSPTTYKNWFATEFAVGIPLVTARTPDGVESLRWVPVVEEIKSTASTSPFTIDSEQRGLVALRINYPFQSASMSSFRHDTNAEDYPFEPTIGRPNAADDGAVTEENPSDRPGDLTGAPLQSGGIYAGTYGGQYGLGAQGAMGSEYFTEGRPVRPYRRVISAQAIYRREVFSN